MLNSSTSFYWGALSLELGPISLSKIMAKKQPISGLSAVLNLNKGHIITREELPAQPSDRKGQYSFRSRRYSLTRYVFTNITDTLKRKNWYKDWCGKEEDGNVRTHIYNCITRIYCMEVFSWKKEGELVCKELPVEVLGEIGKRLPSRLDIVRFRSVCKNWRLSLPSPTRFPLRVPSLPSEIQKNNVPCIITEASIYCLLPWNLRLVVLEEVDQGGKFYAHLRYRSEEYSIEFDKIVCPAMTFTFWWRLRHTPYDRLSFISKGHHLRIASPRSDDPTQFYYHHNKRASKMVIVSSSRDGVNPSYAKQSDLNVVALVSAGAMEGRIALLRLKGSFESWSWDTDFCTRLFQDIMIYRGRLCALDDQGGVVIMDFDDSGLLEMTQLSPPWPDAACGWGAKYLYEDSGDLCLAIGRVNWEAYKLNLGNQMWVSVFPAFTII